MSCRIGAVVLTTFFLLAPVASNAQPADIIIEKKTFEMPSYATAAGETIKSVKIGWQAAGTLSADKSNAILITQYFSSTSHAFGKYAASDKAGGYWDAIIGPGKARTYRFAGMPSACQMQYHLATMPLR
jgi:homoserine O-acetyltransferase